MGDAITSNFSVEGGLVVICFLRDFGFALGPGQRLSTTYSSSRVVAPIETCLSVYWIYAVSNV